MKMNQWENTIRSFPRWKLEKYLEAFKALHDWPEFVQEYGWTGTSTIQTLIETEIERRAAHHAWSKAETWNTARQYSEHGQRIAATVRGKTTYFVDIDRNIEGYFESVWLNDMMPFDAVCLHDVVMEHYDKSWYTDWTPMDGTEHELRAALQEVARG
jgi:hypothetical protein